jgi:hypothetical protein
LNRFKFSREMGAALMSIKHNPLVFRQLALRQGEAAAVL